jgi:regulator of protease activity HflC (stomatin/prohibitin superfamily)
MDQRYIGRGPASPSSPLGRQTGVVAIAAVVLGALFILWMSAFNTHAGTVDIVLRWGAPVRVTEPGLNFKIPFAETRHPVELRERAFIKTYESASRDPMELNVTVAINWAVNKEHVVQL